MNLNFVLNDYVLIWNLLFRASISSNVQTFKQKLWKNYRHSYNELYKEEEHILKDPKNYIPSDDTIFDMVRYSDIYKEIREEMTTNNLFSYSYPAMYNFMIITIELYIGELNRLKEKIKKDPIIALDTEYGYNIAAYEITSFLRGLIDTNATSYIEVLNNILNEIYPKLLEDYNNLPLSPENQLSLTERSITVIRRIRLLIKDMIKDLLDVKLYFIIEPLALDNFYRNINYFLYALDADLKEE